MDTFGEILRTSREKKGYSLEQVARDTNIAKKYLNALEAEDFSIFPGEPYLIGFLKNYSEYLGLDPNEMVTLHRNMKLQEQPVPIDELLDTGKSYYRIIGLFILAAVVLGAGGFFIYRYISSQPEKTAEEQVVPVQEPVTKFSYDLSSADIEERFPEGTQLELLVFDRTFNLQIGSVTSDLGLSWSGRDLHLNLGDEKELDLDADGKPDISVVVNDIDINAKTAVLKLSALDGSTESFSTEGESSVPEPGLSKVESRNRQVSVILESPTADPFILDVVFRGYTLVRYLVDRNERVEQYFDKGEAFRLDVNREVMLWISNSGSFKAKISGVEINLGSPGEVSAHLIKWKKNRESGKYNLELIPVY